MAITPEGDALTRAYRRGLLVLRAMVARDVGAELRSSAWAQRLAAYHAAEERIARLAAMEGMIQSWPSIEAQMTELVAEYRRQAAAEALVYFRQLREAEGVPGYVVPRIVRPSPGNIPVALRATTLATAIRVGAKTATGLSTGMAVATELAPAAVTSAVLVATIGSTTRLVLNAARDTITDTAEDDDAVVGWARITGHNPCSFCAMLASRGPVYRSKRTAKFSSSGRRYHDHCSCIPEPQYSRDADWPGDGRRWQHVWNKATEDAATPEEARLVFRQTVEGRVSH